MGDRDIKLGFSTGALYKFMGHREALAAIRGMGCPWVEFHGHADLITGSDLDGFEYVSLHAPAFEYGDNRETGEIFEAISRVNRLRPFDAVVFHPDRVVDFEVFNRADFAVAFENMDKNKRSYRTVEDMRSLLARSEAYKFVLDVNHVYVNDPTMRLAGDFYRELGKRITHIHLSGYRELHDPLFETRQAEIIKAIQGSDAPIIVESALSSPEDIKRERDYILWSIGSG